MDDASTIDAVLSGDKERYAELVDRYKRAVYAIAWSRLGNQDLAEDAAQETFVKAYQYLGSLRDRTRFSSWIGRIARNVCIGFRWKRSRDLRTAQRFAVESNSDGKLSFEPILDQSFWDCFARLPESSRECLTLFYIDGQSVSQAAIALGISESALKVRLHRARTALRNRIDETLEERLLTLAPSTRFTSSVMGVLPVAPIGLINAGVWMFIAKVCSVTLFPLFLAALYIGLIGALANLAGRIQTSRFKPLIFLFSIAVSIPIMYGMASLVVHFGAILMWRLLALSLCIGSVMTFLKFRFKLTVHGWRPIGASVIQAGPLVALAFFNLPLLWFIPLGLISTIGAIAYPILPSRADYNLFLRAAFGGLPPITVSQKPELSATEDHFRRFMKVLAQCWLVQDYLIEPEHMTLWLTSAKPSFSIAKSMQKSCVTIRQDGKCDAHLSETDRILIDEILRRKVDVESITISVEWSIEKAFMLFAAGNEKDAVLHLNPRTDPSTHRTERFKLISVAIASGALAAFLAVTYHFWSGLVR